MYKKIYKYLGVLTLLWAYSSITVYAVHSIKDFVYNHKRLSITKEDIQEKLHAIIYPLNAHQEKRKEPQLKKNAVMVLGMPHTFLKDMPVEDKYKGDSFLSLERLTVTSKRKGASNDAAKCKKIFIEDWNDYLCQENMFMQKKLCNDTYTQYYVEESFYLPRIYCSENQELPTYIVCPALWLLVKGIFFEQGNDSDAPIMPTLVDEKVRCRYRLEACVTLLSEYMEEVYKLVNIKALVINHDCSLIRGGTGDNRVFGELFELEQIDILIHQFGKLLYKKEESGDQYTINPQVFWLNWYGNNLKEEIKESYLDIQAIWFAPAITTQKTIHLSRQRSLLYPFVKAHTPKIGEDIKRKSLSSKMPQGKEETGKLIKKNWQVEDNLYKYEQKWSDQPTVFFKKRERAQQMFLLKIDNQQEIDNVKGYIIDFINKNDETISPHQLQLARGIRYCYSYSYAELGDWNKMRKEMKFFLCMQDDTPKEKDKTTAEQEWLESCIGDNPDMKSYRFDHSSENKEQYWYELKKHDLKLWNKLNKEYGDRLGFFSRTYYGSNHAFSICCAILFSSFFIFYIIYKKNLVDDQDKRQPKTKPAPKTEQESKIEQESEIKQELKTEQEPKIEQKPEIKQRLKSEQGPIEKFLDRFLVHCFFFCLMLLMILAALYFRRKRKK